MIGVRVRWVVGASVGCLVRGVDVSGSGTYVVYGYGDCCFVLVFVGMECGGVWGKSEVVCVGGGVPRFKLEEVELVRVRLMYAGPMFFVGSG